MNYNDVTDFEEINVRENKHDVEITILCNTYNHKDYLKVALDSFLRQKVEVPFEILIFDDASTDGTSDIVREYAKCFPSIIKAFIAKANTYTHPLRKEMKRVWFEQFACGKYVALCEGDDYWIDDEKLALQYKALEENPDCDMCACWGATVTEDGTKEISQIRPRIGNGILSLEDVILGGGQYIVSAGRFCRRIVLERFSEFEGNLSLDYVTQIRGALRGGIYYIDRKMAAYRRYSKNSWTMRVLRNKDRLSEQWELEKKMLLSLDEYTKHKYHEVISTRLKTYTTFLEQLQDRKGDIKEYLGNIHGEKYLWGLGRRGQDFEEFCREEGIEIAGVCDAVNSQVGEMTIRGNRILHTDDVIKNAGVILASNSFAYNDLKNSGYEGVLIDLQIFMPFG